VSLWLDRALTYTQWYRWSVIPVGADKRPLIPWERYKTEIATVEELRSWPRVNIGLVCGAVSRLVVLDFESRDDAVWFWTSRARARMICQTRRGFHFYYQHPGEPVRNAVKVQDETGRPRFDVRADGGYVLVPPSEPYRWILMPAKSEVLPVFKREWLPERSRDREYKRIHDGAKYIERIRAISGQGGHNETYRAACSLRDSGLDKADALFCLLKWNQTNAEPPWSDWEIRRKIEEAYK
jgi:hypothetical protein